MRPTPEDNIEAAFRVIRGIIEDPSSYPDEMLALPMDPDLIASVLTPQRMRILRELGSRENGTKSVKQLAELLGRDTSRVSRDLGELAERGLVELTRNGKAKQVRRTARVIVLV